MISWITNKQPISARLGGQSDVSSRRAEGRGRGRAFYSREKRKKKQREREEGEVSDTDLVISARGDVADPGECLIVASLDDLEIPDLDARDGKVGDLEFDGDGRTIFGRFLWKRGEKRKNTTNQPRKKGEGNKPS